MTVAPQAVGQETELISGTIVGITQKGEDKWQVAVQTDPASQYTKNLWSSDANLISQLATLIQTHQTFLCRASHWNRADGSPVKSLWIQGVGPDASQIPMPQPPVMPVQPVTTVTPQAQAIITTPHTPARIPESEREDRIMRQTGSKVAAILISHLPSEQRTFDNLIRISENMVGYYKHGVSNPGYDEDGDPGSQGIPHSDDDIPF